MPNLKKQGTVYYLHIIFPEKKKIHIVNNSVVHHKFSTSDIAL